MPLMFTLHLLSAALWVGGMFFAYVALRPAAAQLLEPPLRLPLWGKVFKHFFRWVWAFVILLPLTGYGLIYLKYQGMANVSVGIHIMQFTGWVMILIFAYLYFAPYKKLKHFVAEKNFPEAGKNLNIIRQLVFINLTLGLITLISASTLHY